MNDTNMMAQWVALRPIFKVCRQQETRYENGGWRQLPWWQQKVADYQLRLTLEDILEEAREQRHQESGRCGGRGE